MYADPKLIKKHEVKVRLNDDQYRDLELIVELTGEQKAVILRELYMEGLKAMKKNKLRLVA